MRFWFSSRSMILCVCVILSFFAMLMLPLLRPRRDGRPTRRVRQGRSPGVGPLPAGPRAAGAPPWSPSQRCADSRSPCDFVSTSLIPADSSTARTPPPAMSPVPGDAGFSSTFPAPNLPRTVCGMVPRKTGTQNDVLLRVVDTLRDGVRHLVRLAEADADMSAAVAYHDDGVEAESPSALDNLGYTVDVDELVFQLEFTCLDTCHASSSGC